MTARNRIVRKTTDHDTTTYEVYGHFLSEKAKRTLRNRFGKDETKTWSEVFPNADVIYRFNPTKNKQDVFIGTVCRVKYASGKVRQLSYPELGWMDLQAFENNTPE